MFFVLFFFATLSPTSNLIMPIGTIMAERFMYLPSIAYAGCLVLAVFAICRRLPPALQHPADRAGRRSCLIAFALLVRTYARNNDWLDDETLVDHRGRDQLPPVSKPTWPLLRR